MTIKFNKNFYNIEAIKKAIRTYQKLANFEIKEKKNFVEVTIKNIDKDLKNVLTDEFSNYVLAKTKNES